MAKKSVVAVQAVHLSRAMFCVNCEYISDSEQNCVICESTALISVSRLMNRKGAVTQRQHDKEVMEEAHD